MCSIVSRWGLYGQLNNHAVVAYCAIFLLLLVKAFGMGNFWPIIFFVFVGVGLIGLPFQLLSERENPVDTVSEYVIAALSFGLFVPFGVYCLWMPVCHIAQLNLELLWRRALREGMGKDEVLRALGEPTSRFDEGTDYLGKYYSSWYYRYRWFRLRGNVTFGENDTVTSFSPPSSKPEGSYPGEFSNW